MGQNMVVNPKNDILHIVRNVCVCVLVLLNSGYALTTGITRPILLLTMAFLFVDWCVFGMKIHTQSREFLFLIVTFVSVCITVLINFDFDGYKEYLRILVLFLFSYHICMQYSQKTIVTFFTNAMYVACVASLIMYVMVNVLAIRSFPTVENGYGTAYYTCFLSSLNREIINRNCGLFWEPGMFAGLIFLWLIIETTFKERTRSTTIRCMVGIVTLVTTMSTSGVLYILLIAIMYVLKSKIGKKVVTSFLLKLLILIIVVVILLGFDTIVLIGQKVFPDVFSKLLLNNISVTDRTVGPLADMYVCAQNPFGIGVVHLTEYVQDIAQRVFGTFLHTRTSTFTYYFAAFGFILGGLVIWSFVRFVKNNVDGNFERLLVTLGLLFMCTSTPLHIISIFLIALFMGSSGKRVFNN